MHNDFLFLNYLRYTSQETEIRRHDKSLVCPSLKEIHTVFLYNIHYQFSEPVQPPSKSH